MLEVPAGLFMHLDEFHSELHAACPSAQSLSDLQRRTIFVLQSDSKAEFRSSRRTCVARDPASSRGEVRHDARALHGSGGCERALEPDRIAKVLS